MVFPTYFRRQMNARDMGIEVLKHVYEVRTPLGSRVTICAKFVPSKNDKIRYVKQFDSKQNPFAEK